MTETSPAQAITSNAGYCQQSYPVLISDITRAIKGIEEAFKHLAENAPADDGMNAMIQALQHCSVLPVMLAQQLRAIEGLEQKFGEQFRSMCREEVEEIASLTTFIQDWLATIVSGAPALSLGTQRLLLDKFFKDTARLNLLQQRISGKMMKVKSV